MKQATDRLLPANPVRQDNQKTECQVGIIIRKQNVTDGVANWADENVTDRLANSDPVFIPSIFFNLKISQL